LVYHSIHNLFLLLFNEGKYLLARHFTVVTLFVVIGLIAICPHVVVVGVEFVKFLNHLTGADLCNLLRAIVVTIALFAFTLALLLLLGFLLALFAGTSLFFSLFGGFFFGRQRSF
jgi:hypothetical protein